MGSYVKKASTDMAIGAVKGDKDKVTKTFWYVKSN